MTVSFVSFMQMHFTAKDDDKNNPSLAGECGNFAGLHQEIRSVTSPFMQSVDFRTENLHRFLMNAFTIPQKYQQIMTNKICYSFLLMS